MRWRFRLRSPHAGQQQPMTGRPHSFGVGARLGFGHVHERPNDDVLLVVGDEARRHGLQRCPGRTDSAAAFR